MRAWPALPWIDMDRFYLGTYSSVSRRRRSFHRLGIAIAGAIIAVGLALIGAAMMRLDLLETLAAETFAIVAGFTLVFLGGIAKLHKLRISENFTERLKLTLPAFHSETSVGCSLEQLQQRSNRP